MQMIENFYTALPDIKAIIPIAVDPEQLKSFYGESIPENSLILEADRQDGMLRAMAELSREYDHCFYFYGDTPLLDAVLSRKMYDNHCRYYADYSFADGYPLGLAPEIIASTALTELSKLVGEKSEAIERDSLFSWIQKDINSFDIETEISAVDLRLKRISLSMDNRLNYSQLLSFMKDGFSNASDFMERAAELEKHCRQLPAYYQIQITASCPQSCSYCPYPQIRPGHREDKAHMEQEKLLELCRSIAAFTPDAHVSLSLWGEPSSHPRILEIMKSLKEIPLNYLIETSGIGWPDPDCPYNASLYSESCFQWILSLDALDRDIYRMLRGEGYDEAYGFARKLIAINPERTWIQAVRMKENEDDLEQFYRHWKEINDRVIVQKHDHFCGFLPEKKITDLSPLNRFPCWHLKREICIDLEGRAVLCREDLRGEHILGSCFSENLEEIWKRGETFFENHIKGDYKDLCAECDEYYSFNF